jgi:glutamate carboxypeptidase
MVDLAPGRAARGAPEVRALLEEMVRIESPSSEPTRVLAALEHYADALREVGAAVTFVEGEGRHPHLGPDGVAPPILVAEVAGGEGPEGPGGAGSAVRPLLVVGHLDTVHPVGTLEGALPLRADDQGRLFGPGVYDMKGGLAVLVVALARLRARGERPAGPLRILVTPDEEIGAPTSRSLLEREARGARGALVLEPPLPGGHPKIERKGVGEYRLVLKGRAAHAGIEPERGASAIHALGDLLPRLVALADPPTGTTVNVGRVAGGGPVNVVADRAELQVDVRVASASESERVSREIRALVPSDPRVALEVEGGMNRPPLERSDEGMRLLAMAREVARELGRDRFEGGATGGGSDGNLLAAAGCPVLDGLGVEGDGAHTHEEFVVVADLAWRVRFLAGLLARA